MAVSVLVVALVVVMAAFSTLGESFLVRLAVCAPEVCDADSDWSTLVGAAAQPDGPPSAPITCDIGHDADGWFHR
jgi:hypothetical protein